jgi:hypothetical protein
MSPGDRHHPLAPVIISEDAIAKLMALGFDREESHQALVHADGNVEAACNFLLDQ